MPTNSKSAPKKKTKAPLHKRVITSSRTRLNEYLSRRPHRSFRLTRRRDYVRPLVLPKLLPFTFEVTKMLWVKRRIFGPLMLIYILLYALLVGIGSQETYVQLTEFLKESSSSILEAGGTVWAQTGLTLVTLAMTGLNTELTDAQQIFGVLLGVLAWLTTVWLLRNILAGHKVKMRDGLYNAGAPLISTLIIALIIALQLLPVALAAVGYSAAVSSGLIAAGGVEAMLFWVAAILLSLISLYWISSSFFAMVIVTLPGMYPYAAIKAAGDIVIGRRVKLVLRWVWMLFCIVVLWVIVMLPVILLDTWVKSFWSFIANVPVVPVALVVVSAYTIFWISTYVYLLYRKVVDNNE